MTWPPAVSWELIVFCGTLPATDAYLGRPVRPPRLSRHGCYYTGFSPPPPPIGIRSFKIKKSGKTNVDKWNHFLLMDGATGRWGAWQEGHRPKTVENHWLMFSFQIVDRIRPQSSWASCEFSTHRQCDVTWQLSVHRQCVLDLKQDVKLLAHSVGVHPVLPLIFRSSILIPFFLFPLIRLWM